MNRFTLLFTLMMLACSTAFAAVEPMQFDTPEQEYRYQELMKELRCLVCQNQSLAESNAGLAGDLRKLTHEMVLDNKTDSEIVEFLVSRYGDFVLYRPPVKESTYLLWFGPLILALLGVVVVVIVIRRRVQGTDVVLDEDEESNLAQLLKESSDDSSTEPSTSTSSKAGE